MKRSLCALVLFALPAYALAAPFNISVTGGKTDETNVVVRVPVPKGTDAAGLNVVEFPNAAVPAQVVKPGLTDDPAVKQYLVFVLPKLKAGETITGQTKTVNYFAAPPQFAFLEAKGEPTDVSIVSAKGNRPVLQYFNLPHDPADHFYTFKPFHHVYDPATGKTLLTNGAVKTNKEGL